MGLTWWPVAIAGIVCLATAVALAALLPMEQVRRQLRPMANTFRLTRLPEYARLARTRMLSTVVTITLLVLLFGSTVVAAARPSGLSWTLGTAAPVDDIMLCVDQPVSDPSTGQFLTYFAAQAKTYGTQRIGLTSPNRRVVPLTRDYQYAAGRFGNVAELARSQDDGDEPSPQQSAVQSEIARFAPPVTYSDYAPSTADVLALCMTGFPSFGSSSTHRRSVIYLGPGEIRSRDETRPSLFTADAVKRMAAEAGVQINALTPPDQSAETLASLVKTTGGRHFSIQADGSDMAAHLDAIRANPPNPAAISDATAFGWVSDSPTIPLVVALAASLLLCLSLVVLRR